MDGENNNGAVEQADRQDEISDLRDDQRLNTPGAGNKLVADKPADAVDADPFAYRNRSDNARKRAEYMERLLVDHFAGGDVRRFDRDAGLDFEA